MDFFADLTEAEYQLELAGTQIPWIFAAFFIVFGIFVVSVGLFRRSRREDKKLKDIAEKRTYELALQSSTLAALLDSIPDLIFTKNLDSRFLHCNKAFLEHFNKTLEEVTGSLDGSGFGITDKEANEFIEVDRMVIRERRPIKIEEYIPRFDGARPFYETIKIPLMMNGDIIGIMGISRDITERKRMEKRMAFSYEYSKKLSDALARITKSPAISAGNIEAAADVIAQEGCHALNANCVGIWNLSEDENFLNGISYYDSATQRNTVMNNFDLKNRRDYIRLLKTERIIVMNDNEECKKLSSIFDGYYDQLCGALDAPIRVDGKLFGVVSVEQKFTETYQGKREWLIEEKNFASSLADLMTLAISSFERNKAREAAEIASKSKSSFLANMSHEIRTPMNAILGVTEILIQNDTLSEEIEEGLGKIYSSCNLLLGIINDILDFSKIEAGKVDIIPNRYKVAGMINDSIQLNLMRIESKPIEFIININENIPAKLIGDELRIKQILNNLLSNAFKYTDTGKVTLSVDYETCQSSDSVILLLSVRDTGHGMTSEQLSQMYNEYSRFNRVNSVSVEGTGLGLAITQRLINLMNGQIHVESYPKEGSYFSVRLEQQLVDDEILGHEAAENLRQFRMNYMKYRKKEKIARDPMPYGNVLVVDDVETNIYVAVGLLKLYKLQIDTAKSGREALDKIKNGKKYDIIFMDHMMPGMDGIEATKQLRGMGYKEPVVALTANAVAGQSDIFKKNGFDDFISKPIDIRQLNSVLNKMVRDKQTPDVIEAARRQNSKAAGTESIKAQLLRNDMPGADSGEYPENDDSNESSALDIIEMGRDISGLDIKKGLERYEGDEYTYLKVLRSYALNIRTLLDSMEDIKEEDLNNYRISVHGVKGTSLNVYAEQLGKSAGALEKAAANGDYEFVKSNNGAFHKAAQKLVCDLEGFFMKLDSRNPKEKKDKPDKKMLSKLLEACNDNDIDKADKAMDEIDMYQYDMDEGLVDWLRDNVYKIDFNQIVQKLTSLVL